METRLERVLRVVLVAALAVIGSARPAEAQLGALLSPGRLSKAHAELEGLLSCTKCHERGRRVAPEKCLGCHKPVAERIAMRKGIHKDAADDCISCHVDHAGPEANLRPFDTTRFDHAAVAGFALDDKHAKVATRCDACHKTRSFLTASPSCATCHDDVHKARLGPTCETCHSTQEAFVAARASFDHSKTDYPLTGAHRTTACTGCHADQTFATARRFETCASCHKTPHQPSMSTVCTTCHTTGSWRTSRFDHDSTDFKLVGLHARVDCAKCHTRSAARVRLRADTCAACHTDTHRGEFTQDCAACHDEHGFAPASFDHDAKTTFALTQGHADLDCVTCHKTLSAGAVPLARKVLDFRGLETSCATCHADPHEPTLAETCDTCHSRDTFRVASFRHPDFPEFFSGRHAPVTCVSCHVPAASTPGQPEPSRATATFRGLSRSCATCHDDVHLGQVSASCETCHSLDAEDFEPDRFRHDRVSFTLDGRHARVRCLSCHEREQGIFPSGPGVAVRLTGIDRACATCHDDVHLGQVGATCDGCHDAASFKVASYRHQTPPRGFFEGRHITAVCSACHTKATGTFPAGRGTAIRFALETDCVSCHTDVHNGSLGRDCIVCHKPEPLRPSHLAAPTGVPEGTGP